MLDWLSSLKYFGKHNRLRKEVHRTNPQSGQWFLESEKFSTWDFLPQTFLWLYGPCEPVPFVFHLPNPTH